MQQGWFRIQFMRVRHNGVKPSSSRSFAKSMTRWWEILIDLVKVRLLTTTLFHQDLEEWDCKQHQNILHSSSTAFLHRFPVDMRKKGSQTLSGKGHEKKELALIDKSHCHNENLTPVSAGNDIVDNDTICLWYSKVYRLWRQSVNRKKVFYRFGASEVWMKGNGQSLFPIIIYKSAGSLCSFVRASARGTCQTLLWPSSSQVSLIDWPSYQR